MTTNELHAIAVQETDRWLTIADQKYGKHFARPSISLKLRGRVAGYWSPSDFSMRLNESLFRENLEDFNTNTIPHELAHMLCHELYPHVHKIHGFHWKDIMRTLGVSEVKRCHSYSTVAARVVPKPYKYKCACREWDLTKLLHRKIMAGRHRRCPHCHQRVEFLYQSVLNA